MHFFEFDLHSQLEKYYGRGMGNCFGAGLIGIFFRDGSRHLIRSQLCVYFDFLPN